MSILKTNKHNTLKLGIIILILLLSRQLSIAQCRPVQHVEFDFWGGCTGPVGTIHGSEMLLGSNFGASLQYNISQSPYDVGIFYQVDNARHDVTFDNIAYYYQINRTLSIGAISHYNFHQGERINPYVGVALGVAIEDQPGNTVIKGHRTCISLMPQCGVRIWQWLRVTTYIQFSRRGYNTMGINLGICIGGRAKKISLAQLAD